MFEIFIGSMFEISFEINVKTSLEPSMKYALKGMFTFFELIRRSIIEIILKHF